MQDTHILVIDDDEGLRSLLREYLTKHDYRVSVRESAEAARELMQVFRFDLLIVDIMMPDETGIEFTSAVRDGNDESHNVPILMLTAMGEGEDRISGLQVGADDYLPKPFEPEELLLRIQAILRRTLSEARSLPNLPAEVRFGDFAFDLTDKRLTGGDSTPIYLTEGEADLLHVLASRANQAVGREDIMRLCGLNVGAEGANGTNGGGAGARSVDVQITRLRGKLESNPKRPQYLMTIRNKGYLLRCER